MLPYCNSPNIYWSNSRQLIIVMHSKELHLLPKYSIDVYILNQASIIGRKYLIKFVMLTAMNIRGFVNEYFKTADTRCPNH